MKEGKVVISGAGCCLIDRIYNNVHFDSDEFKRYTSLKVGDGGLIPGKLEFEENFEQFMGEKFSNLLPDIVKGRDADKVNIGGPCIVALINLAQLTNGLSDVRFYGCYGDDSIGDILVSQLSKTPVNIDKYKLEAGYETASTTVLSDPLFDDGHGERIFVNTIGASWNFDEDKLDDSFYNSDIVVLGATAIVPNLHKSLDKVLEKAKRKGCMTVVTTVFDSINERLAPDKRWPMGSSDDSYKYIDLLITDKEEAIRLSGESSIEDALRFFESHGVGSAIVTNGPKNVYFYSSGDKFKSQNISELPVSEAVGTELKKGRKGDTTGCGDNFAGGVISSVVFQMRENVEKFDIVEACVWGIISGGFACFYFGGTYFEETPGEKKAFIEPYYEKYKEQIKSIVL
jgi:sugar/nucleoside kinase (ribokinase family)